MGRQGDQAGKDGQQVREIKEEDGNVLMVEESILRRWKECSEELMTVDNERETGEHQ